MSKDKRFLTHSGLFFNAFFIIFLLFLHKPLLHASYSISHGDTKITTLGIIFGLIILLDFIGILIKIPRIYARANSKEAKETNSLIFPLWLGRTAVTGIIAVMAIKAFGVEVDGGSALAQTIMLAIVIKEIFIMIYVGLKSEKSDEFTNDKLKEYNFKELLADAFIWIYITIAYTAIWETIGMQDPLREYSGGELWAQGFAEIILCILIAPPLRMPYLIEEVILIDTNKERLIWLGGFALMLATAVWKIY